MEEKRRGRQTPTVGFTLPYQTTKGPEAIGLYNSTGRTAQEWQENLIYDMMATDEEGLWVHSRYGYSLPRQNGKNEVVSMRELWALEHGERCLHTAHRTATSRSAWERLVMLVEARGIKEIKGKNLEGYKSGKSKGQEWIEFDADHGGGRVSFRTRSTTGGLGETFDLLVIDEAQEYQDDQESALKYTIVSSDNPQTVFLGTPPTPYSSGTKFVEYRRSVLIGEMKHAGWAEWSVESMTDVSNRDAWYETNPSLGYKLTERAIEDEVGQDQTDFNIQRLGLWIKYNQKSAISEREWNELEVKSLPALTGQMAVGIKFNKDGGSVSLAIAVASAEDKVFTECIGCRSMRDGIDWILEFLSRSQYSKVIVDGRNGFDMLAKAMQEEHLKKPLEVNVREWIDANAQFEQRIFAKTLQHMNQPSVLQIISNCEKRAVGTGGGFAYKEIVASHDISIMDAIILAVWGVQKAKKRKQQISY